MTALSQDVVADLTRENARLLAELNTARDRQAGSAEILRTIGSVSGDAEQSLDQIAETTKRLFEAFSVTIFVAEGDEWGQVIHDGASSKRIGAEVPVAQLRIGGHSLPGAASARTGRFIFPISTTSIPRLPTGPVCVRHVQAGTRTLCGTPLRRAGQAIGVLIVHRDRLAPFTAEELALLQNFADQTAIAIENARLFNETQQALEQQKASADILSVISNSVADTRPVFDKILRSIEHLFGGQERLIFLLGEDGLLHIGAVHGVDPELTRRIFPVPLEGTATEMAIRERRLVRFADVFSDPDVPPGLRAIARRRGENYSLMIAPMLGEGRAIGSIMVSRSSMEAFTDKECALLRTFADQAVIAIQNARLFNETREALERQTATADILKVIASSPSDVQPVFEAIATSSNRLIGGFSTAVFRVIDGLIHLTAFTPTNSAADEALKASFPRRLTDFPYFALVREGAATQIVDTELEPAVRDLARLRGYRSMLFTPLMSNGAPIGMISVTRKEPGKFAEHHVHLLKTFADQAVIAIENVRLFDEVQARTKELAGSLEELRTAQDRLVQTEKLASLGQLTAGIAHEIKNPLNFVNNFSALSAELTDELNDVLRSVTLADKTREEVDELTGLLKDNLQKVVQHGKRADSIVKNMLLHSREGSGDHRPADINALLDESLNLAYHGARAEKRSSTSPCKGTSMRWPARSRYFRKKSPACS